MYLEMSVFNRVIVSVFDHYFGISPYTGITNSWRIMMGIPILSWYDRHRQAYVLTGEQIELDRMCRHVTLMGVR